MIEQFSLDGVFGKAEVCEQQNRWNTKLQEVQSKSGQLSPLSGITASMSSASEFGRAGDHMQLCNLPTTG